MPSTKPSFGLTKTPFNTHFAPLCVLGYVINQRKTLQTVVDFDAIPEKAIEHTTGQKLIDIFLHILTGYSALHTFNLHLRPDHILAQAWSRKRFADQSSLSRTLDAFAQSENALAQFRQVAFQFWHENSQLRTHDWRKPVILDVDLTSLPASRYAEGSTKGYIGKKRDRATSRSDDGSSV